MALEEGAVGARFAVRLVLKVRPKCASIAIDPFRTGLA
jgi:hypothetical protein